MSEINEAMIHLNAEAATKLESRAKTLEEAVQNIQEVMRHSNS